MSKKLIVDVGTGEQKVEDMTPEEISEMEARAAEAEQRQLELEQAQSELEANKQSAKDKLASLGLTEAEVIALLGN